MANTYEWSIQGLNKNLNVDQIQFKDAIETVTWKFRVKNENGIFIELVGQTELDPPTSDTYTPYESLTKSQLIEWVQANTDMDALKLEGDNELFKVTQNTEITLRDDLR